MIETLRELDAMVAEKVMGLSTRFERGRPVAWRGDVPILWSLNDYVLLDEDGSVKQILYVPGGIDAHCVDRYSTDIACAWKLAEKLSLWVCPAENAHGWVAGQLAGEEPSPGGGVYGDTAPMAICLAALRVGTA